MLNLKEVNIDDKSLFDKYILKHKPQASELNFTNIFMWRNFYRFRFAEIGGLLCLISAPDDTEPFAFAPIGEYTVEGFITAVTSIKEYFKTNEWKLVFKKVEEDKVGFFEKYAEDDKDIILDRDNCDYLYLSDNLVNLSGKKYHSKRNHINSFKKQYRYEYVTLREELIDECIRINEEWCAKRSCELHKGMYCEKIANNEALRNFKRLGYEGALIKVDGRYEAYTIGELLNQDTAVIHIEKANDSIRGLYSIVSQQFCENKWKDIMYINREQDLGMDGLRKAKLSYNPSRMVNKYSITFHELMKLV